MGSVCGPFADDAPWVTHNWTINHLPLLSARRPRNGITMGVFDIGEAFIVRARGVVQGIGIGVLSQVLLG